MELPNRKLPRMRGYDYSQEAAYYVTICSYERKPIFGEIIKTGNTHVFTPSRIEELVRLTYVQLPSRFPEFDLVHFSLLPNHLHFLTIKKERQDGVRISLSDLVGAFKSLSDRAVRNEISLQKIWQKSFHDHIIRDEQDFQTHWLYIEENVNRWFEDEYL